MITNVIIVTIAPVDNEFELDPKRSVKISKNYELTEENTD